MTVFLSRGRDSSIPIRARWPTSSAVPMSSSTLAMRSIFCLFRPHAYSLSLQADVEPSLILSRVKAASGVNYTAQREAPRKFEPIAPVGTNYVPIGKVDIAAIRQGAAKPPAAPPATKPVLPTAPRPVPGAPSPAARAPIVSKAPADAWADESDSFAPPPPPPAASRPTPAASFVKPAPAASSVSCAEPMRG